MLRVPKYRAGLVDPYREHLRKRRAEECAVPVQHLFGRIGEAVSDAVSSVPRAFGELLTPLSGWTTPWTMEGARTELGVDRARIAGAVHAFLQRGLIQHVAQGAGKNVLFTVLNVVRSYLRTQ